MNCKKCGSIKFESKGRSKKNKKGEYIPLEVKPGNKILFTKYGPTEIKVEDKEYLIAKEEDILAILE